MAKLTFRDLRADEIDCRVATCSEKGLSLLLYKDARCDMIILDETVGAMNWQRHHSRDNANCSVSIWDEDKKQWIEKEDTGTESNTEAQKGLASDSFKRACFNWGIGRELYTAPFIWIPAGSYNASTNRQGKPSTNDRFTVEEIVIKDKKIVALSIRNNSLKKVVYTFGNVNSKATPAKATQGENKANIVTRLAEQPAKEIPSAQSKRIELKEFCVKYGISTQDVIRHCGLNPDSVLQDYVNALEYAKAIVDERHGDGQLPFEV